MIALPRFNKKVLAFVIGINLCSVAVAEDVQINIEKQSLVSALDKLSQTTSLEFIYSDNLLNNQDAVATSGVMSSEQAVKRLLQGTGLSYEFISENTVLLKQGDSPSGTQSRSGVPHLEEDIEEVVVYASYGGALKRALDLKRNSNDFVDSIQAEDLGKFPDANLAESIQRIPGVQVTRDATGEASDINMRGLGSSFIRTSLNGMPVSLASGSGRSFSFGLFPSEMFSAVEVYKSSRASTIEGGMAGTIVMRTAHPFDYDGMKAKYSLAGNYSETSEKTNPKGSFIVSNTWNDTFGALFTMSTAKRSFKSEESNMTNWTRGKVPGISKNDLEEPGGQGFDWNLEEGNNSGLTDEELANAWLPRQPQSNVKEGFNKRTGAYAAFQWRPNDDIDVALELMYAKKEDFVETNLNRMRFQGTKSNKADSEGYLAPYNFVREGMFVTSGTVEGAIFRTDLDRNEKTTDFKQVALNGAWQMHEYAKLDWRLATNTSELDGSNFAARFKTIPTTVDFELKNTLLAITPSIDMEDTSNWVFDNMKVTALDYREDTNNTYKFDLTLGDPDNNFRVGILNHAFKRDKDRLQWREEVFDEVIALTGLYPEGTSASDLNVSDYARAMGSDFGENLRDDPGLTRWIEADWKAIESSPFLSQEIKDAAPPHLGIRSTLKEDTFSAYIETNLTTEVAEREVRINAGVRMINTTVDTLAYKHEGEIDYNGTLTPARLKVDYSGYVPSFTISANLTEDVLFKFAGSRSMTRPEPEKLSFKVKVNDDGDVQQGNPDLSPYYADQLDLGLQWYFAERSILAAGYFYKNIDGWIENITYNAPFSEAGIDINLLTEEQQLALDNSVDTEVEFKTVNNSDDLIQIEGIEFIFQTPLDFALPGLGLELNYSKINFKGDRTVNGLSENSYNVVTYLDRETYNARLAYNYRGDYATCAEYCQDGHPWGRYRNSAGFLNFSAGFKLSKVFNLSNDLRLNFSVNNLTDERQRNYWGLEDNLLNTKYNGRTFNLSLRGEF